MSKMLNLKAKLGLDVFKENKAFHIKIKSGMEKDNRLKRVVLVCPAGLYSLSDSGTVELSVDGCLECGTCLIACGSEVLEWQYPETGGVQFRFG